MKYVNLYLVVLSLFLTSGLIKTEKTSTGYYPGERLPNIVINGMEEKTLDLSEYKGKKVVLNFWAAYDAHSRANNVAFHNYIKEHAAEDVAFISISFDENFNVFERTMLLDKIDTHSQFYVANGTESKIYKDFQLNKGFRNYIIDEDGIIKEMNITVEKLKELT